MKIEIKEEKENPLLHRKEISLILREFDGTPKKEEVAKEIAKKVNAKEELISVDAIRQEYGKSEAVCYAEIYETLEHKTRYKPEYKTGEAAKEEEKAEEKTEKKAEEAPKEPEKTEEKKPVETKKEDEEKTEAKEAE